MIRIGKALATLPLFGLLLGPGNACAQESIGDFFLFERGDGETGGGGSSITTLAEENYVSGTGGLTVHCTEAGLELVLTATYLGRGTRSTVEYAFGADAATSSAWTVRSSGMAAVAPPDVRDGFLERALVASSVSLRVLDFQMRPHTYTFHLDGLEQGLARLHCR